MSCWIQVYCTRSLKELSFDRNRLAILFKRLERGTFQLHDGEGHAEVVHDDTDKAPLLASRAMGFIERFYEIGEEARTKELAGAKLLAWRKKKSLYAGGVEGAVRLCTLFTLIGTRRLPGVDAYGYLAWALERVVPHPDPTTAGTSREGEGE